jgi:hypothetical protein
MKISHSLSHLEPEKPTWQPHSKKVVLCLVQVPPFRQESSQVSAEKEAKLNNFKILKTMNIK